MAEPETGGEMAALGGASGGVGAKRQRMRERRREGARQTLGSPSRRRRPLRRRRQGPGLGSPNRCREGTGPLSRSGLP